MIYFAPGQIAYEERCHKDSPEWHLSMQKIGSYWCAFCYGHLLKKFPTHELCRTYLFDSAAEEVKDMAYEKGMTTRQLVSIWRKEAHYDLCRNVRRHD